MTATSLLFVASLFEDQPTLVDISSAIPIKRLLPSAPKRPRLEGEDGTTGKQDAKQNTCVTIFTSSGHHILAGTSKGWLNIIETATCESIYSTRLSSGVVIFLRLTVSGRDMVVNSSDRILRTIHMPNLTEAKVDPDSITIEVEHKFQDVVNRLSWNHVAFSSTGEYVMASTYKNHDIYVWERSHGSLVKILEGPKEELGVVEVSRRATESLIHFVESSADIPFSNSQWHPHRPLVAACGLESGHIYLWTINTPQRWSALAPDFAEVEENVEYIEREDEFDIHPIEEIHKRRLDLEDENVDVLTVEPRKGLGVEDDESGDGSGIEDDEDTRRGRHGDATAEGGQTPRRGNGAFRMPVLLDISESESEEEIVTVGPGTMRRKSPVEGREWMNGSGGGAGGDGGTGAGAGAGPAESGGGSDFERGPGRAVNGTRRTAAAAVSTTTTATATAAAAAASNGPSSTSNKRSRKR
ncbi:MAG: chromatin binding protein [Sclerophora amabilis]|nr:MAG: chromatin binding protein [Sclerophora amabilis]